MTLSTGLPSNVRCCVLHRSFQRPELDAFLSTAGQLAKILDDAMVCANSDNIRVRLGCGFSGAAPKQSMSASCEVCLQLELDSSGSASASSGPARGGSLRQGNLALGYALDKL